MINLSMFSRIALCLFGTLLLAGCEAKNVSSASKPVKLTDQDLLKWGYLKPPVYGFDICEKFNPESEKAGVFFGRLESVGERLLSSGDIEKAIICYEHASLFIHGDASKVLARIYETGYEDVVPKDLARAYLHYTIRYRFYKDETSKAKIDFINPLLSPTEFDWVNQQKKQRLQFLSKWVASQNKHSVSEKLKTKKSYQE